METVQQSVLHLDHGGMPPQAQMPYTPRSSALHRASQQGDSLPYKPRQAPPSSASPASPVTGRQAGYVNFTSATAREAAMRYVQQQSFGGGVPYQYAARNVVTDRSQTQPSSQVQMQPSVQPPPPQQHPQHQGTPQPRQHTPHQATSSPHQHPSHPSTPQPHQHSSHQATPQSHQHPPHQTTPQPHQHPSHPTTPQPHLHPSHPTTPQPHLHPSHPTTPQPHLHPSHQALVQSHQHPPQQTTPQPIQHPSQQAMPQSHQHPSQQTMPQSHQHPSQQAASQSHQHLPHLATSQSHQHPPHLSMPQPHQHPPHQTTPQPHQHPPHQATQQPHQHPPHQATAQLNQHPLHQATPQSHQHLSHQGTPQSHQHPSHQTTPQPHQHPSHQVTSQPLQHMSQTPQPQHPPHQATPQPHQHPPQQTIQPPHQHSPHQATQPTHQHTPSQVTTQPQPSQQPPQSQPQMQFEFIRELPHPPQIRSRISLLPPNSDYMTGLARSRLQQAEMYRENVATSMGASSGSSMQNDVMPPFKKIRLGEMKAEVQKPLRIDTRDQPAYNPEVENISPTIPPDPIVPEDAAFRTTKDELLQQISKVDREILKAETQISNLKKKRQELEKAANKPACIEEEEEVAQPKHQSLAQKIYAVNRKKSQEAHERLDKLGPKVELPLYNQPSDTPVYHENKIRHLAIKTRLIEHLKRRHVERENREKNMTATYSKMMQEWLRKVEKIESSLKRKLKESRNREFFEKVFPELRKQREDRERFNRVGARIKSEADLEEIMDSLQEQEMEDKKMRSYAVIPPILLHPHQREVTYTNNNALIEDFAAEYKERQLLNVWTDAEKDIFKEKYLQHPKNFGVVASYLDRKNVCDSVQHYYLSKKTENYKQLLRKSRQRTRTSRNNPHTKPSTVTTSMTEGLSGPTGVTTRLQREQKAKQEEPRKPVLLYGDEMHEDCNSEKLHSDEVVADVVGFQNFLDSWVVRDITSSATTTTTTVTTTNSTLTVTMTTVALSTIPSSVPSVTITPPSNFAPTSNDSLKPINNNNDVSSSKDPMVVSDQDAVEKTTKNISEEKEKLENKKKERRKEGKRKKEEMETSDDECIDTQEKGGVHPCIVCKTSLDQFLQSRPLPRSHALQYGLSEDQITPGARVCNTCRCKSVRSRYTQCPMPKCPNGKGRVKRLRSLPGKWAELPPEIRNPIIVEFQIPETLTKCCSACFNRISRRLAPHIQDGNAIADDDQLSQCQQLRWSEEEIESAKRALKEFGTNWSKVAERVGNTKTHHQCKNFYFNYRKKMGLDLLVQEYNKNHLGEERKPTVTDEEESGSSTSSCDEMSGVPLNSDTDSAASPNNSQPIEEKRSSPMKTVLVSDVREEQLDLAKVRQATETGETKAPNPPTQTAVCKEDYDSSATETADEGQGGADADASAVVRQSPKTINYPISSTSVTVVPSQPEVNGPVREGSPPTRSVKDLVLGMIEMQLLKNPGGHGNNTSVNLSGTIVEPTISSILKTDHHAEIHRSDITFGREYRSEAKSRQVQVTQDTSLATLSVVNSHHSSTPTSLHPHLPPPGSSLLERIPQCMQATITQCSTPSSVEFPKEGLVVVQVQQALRENEGVTLDLSIKKPRECSPSPLASIVRDSSPMGSRGDSPYQPIHQHHHHESPSLPPHTTLHTIPPPAHSKTVPSIHHPPSQPSVTVYRTSGVSGETGYYSHPVVLPPEQVHNVSKSQSVFPSETRGSSGPTPHLVMNQLQTQSRVATSTKMLKSAGHSVKVSPKLTHVAAKGGSITHGTPVSTAPLMVPSHLPPFMLQHPPRFEGLLRQMTPPQQTPAHGKDGTPLSGSITQGTPMHHVPHHLSSDKRVERTLIPIPGAVHDYYKRLSPAAPNVGNNPSNVVSGTYPPYPRDGSSIQTTSASGVFTSPYPHQASRPAGYATQQQLSSRQIIMNDYITSQQMDVSRRGSLGLGSNAPLDKTASQQDSPSPRIVSSSPHYYPPSSAASVYCRSSPANSNIMEQSQTPPHHTHTPPTRQGVIQRHNTNPCVQSRPPSSGNTKPPSPAASPHQRLHFLPHHPPTHHPHHHFPPLYPPPPGHEAFSSLVDVAVQQPSLPVPQKDSEKRQSTHHMHHHEGLGKSMADSLSNVRLLAEHQHQERERFSHLPPDQQRFVGFSKDWDVHSEQQRFHQDRFGPSLREGNPEIQQRMAASVREREREREREKDRERERENHLQQQQQRELQHHQQQMHLQKQIQQQQHQQLQLHRQQLQASHQHHNQPQQQQQQQQQQHQQQQQTRITSGYESQKLAMYRENYRDTSDLNVRPQLLDRSFPREIPNAPPRHLPSSQQQLTHGDNRERELSNSGTPRGQGSSSRVAPGGDSSTLTAASLIDAIITHQINQSSTDSSVPGASSGGNSGSLPTRPGDRLFQGVHRDQPAPSSVHQSAGLHIPESNGKTSPLKSSHSPNVVHLDHEQQPTQQESSAPGNNTKVITLAEHIDSIITKDFNINPPTSAVSAHIAPHHRNMAQIYPHHPYHLLPPLPPTSTVAAELLAEHQSWKLRKALQQQAKEMEVAREREKSSTAPGNALQSDERQIIRVAQPQSPRTKTSSGSYHMEPLSPSEHVASGHHWLPGGSVGSAGPSESMSFLPSRGRYSSEQTKDKPSHLSPLDYVKNRIVEVMRTSEEEKSEQAMTNQKQQPRHHQQHFGGKLGNHPEEKNVFSGDAQDRRLIDDEARHQNKHQDNDHRESGVKVSDKDRQERRCDSPGEMVIDESAGQGNLNDIVGNKLNSMMKGSSPNISIDNVGNRGTGGFPKSSLSVVNPISSTFSIPSITTVSSSVAAAFVPPSTTYAYPFSALNVPSAARSPTPAQVSSVSTKIPVSGANNTNNIQISQQSKTLGSGQSQQSSVPASNSQSDVSSRSVEPAPLLSAQYEPLSDED